jgi:hypothetical protein
MITRGIYCRPFSRRLKNRLAAFPSALLNENIKDNTVLIHSAQKIALSTLDPNVGSEAGMSGNNNGPLAEAIQQGMSQGINQIDQQVVSRSLNVQPTITIQPEFPVRVMVTRDRAVARHRDSRSRSVPARQIYTTLRHRAAPCSIAARWIIEVAYGEFID